MYKILAWVGLAVLLGLHLDFWRPPSMGLYWGWLPEELGYRVLWVLVAWVYIWFFCGKIWRGEDD